MWLMLSDVNQMAELSEEGQKLVYDMLIKEELKIKEKDIMELTEGLKYKKQNLTEDQKNERINRIEENFQKSIERYKKDFKNIKVCIDISERDFKREYISQIYQGVKKLKEDGFSVQISLQSISSEDTLEGKTMYHYSTDEIKWFNELENKIAKEVDGGELLFAEGDLSDPVSFSEVLKANLIIKDIASDIKRLNLSPFETVVYVHNICTKFKYLETPNKSENQKSRLLPKILDQGYIVCVGYATMFKAVCDELNIPGLKVDLNACYVGNGVVMPTFSGHANNIVDINDPKYGIQGRYMEDSCWDAIFPEMENARTMTHCLYPVQDILKHKEGKILQRGTNFLYKHFVSVNFDKELYYAKRKMDKFKILQKRKKDLKERTKDVVENERNGKPIPVVKYKEALIEVQKKCGIQNDVAVVSADKMIKDSILKAKKCLKRGALSAFAGENLSQKEKQKKTNYSLHEVNAEDVKDYNKKVLQNQIDPSMGI